MGSSTPSVPSVLRDALVALWTDRRSDTHRDLYAEAMLAVQSLDQERP